MSDPDHVLAAIDSALTDYGVSDDAMRWTPEPPKESGVYVGTTPAREWCERFIEQCEASVNRWMPHSHQDSAFFVGSCGLCGESPMEDRHRESGDVDDVTLVLQNFEYWHGGDGAYVVTTPSFIHSRWKP